MCRPPSIIKDIRSSSLWDVLIPATPRSVWTPRLQFAAADFRGHPLSRSERFLAATMKMVNYIGVIEKLRGLFLIGTMFGVHWQLITANGPDNFFWLRAVLHRRAALISVHR